MEVRRRTLVRCSRHSASEVRDLGSYQGVLAVVVRDDCAAPGVSILDLRLQERVNGHFGGIHPDSEGIRPNLGKIRSS